MANSSRKQEILQPESCTNFVGSLRDSEGRCADIRHGLRLGGHLQAEEDRDRGGRQHRGKEVRITSSNMFGLVIVIC